jgi:hypothetical protein
MGQVVRVPAGFLHLAGGVQLPERIREIAQLAQHVADVRSRLGHQLGLRFGFGAGQDGAVDVERVLVLTQRRIDVGQPAPYLVQTAGGASSPKSSRARR